MNFLSHYYSDHIKGNPHFNTGLILPDLLATFNRKWKIRNLAIGASLEKKTMNLLEGSFQHLETDKIFHNSDFFKKQVSSIKAILQKHQLNNLPFRPFFVSHIMLELLMDRILIIDKPTLLSHFYADLDKIQRNELFQFLTLLGFDNKFSFFEFFNRFRESKFLYSYPDDQRFVNSLNRTFIRANQPVMEKENRTRIIKVLREAEKNLSTELNKVFSST